MANFDDKLKTINRRIGQKVNKGEREVARRYAKALTEIRAMMAEQYEKYEINGELSYREMLKHDRLKKFMREVNFLLRTNYGDIYKIINELLGDSYVEGYYMTAWAVETSSKTKIGYSTVRPETLAAMLDNPIAGLTLTERLELYRTQIIYNIQQQVTQGLQKNEPYSKMAKRLKKSLEGDAVKAMRIVRTEGHRVQESAKHDAVEHANNSGVVMVKTWNTMEDSRVRREKADHKRLNNKTIPIDEEFSDGLGEGKTPGQLGEAGSDINCRCFLTYSIEKIEKRKYNEIEEYTFERWKSERLKK